MPNQSREVRDSGTTLEVREAISEQPPSGERSTQAESRIQQTRRDERTPRPDQVQLSENGSYYLDFVRALATNLVLIGHGSAIFGFEREIPTGATGVVAFFLLSGFLITLAAHRRWTVAGGFESFMIDRAARIFVAFWPALVLVALVDAALDLRHRGQVGVNTGPYAFIANALLLNDYPAFQAAGRALDVSRVFPRSYNSAEPFWTIPLEFWNYVVFAVFAFCVVRRDRVSPWLLWPLALVGTPVALWNAFAGGSGVLTLVWILGSLAGYFWATHRPTGVLNARLGYIAIAFGAVGLAGQTAQNGYSAYDFQHVAFIAALLFGVLLVVDEARLTARAPGRLMSFLASYSYSLYLLHNTVLVVFEEKLRGYLGRSTPLAGFIAAHVVAFAFSLAFERHYKRVGAWVKQRWLAAPRTLRSEVTVS